MKVLKIYFSLLLAFASLNVFSQQRFEAEITQQVTDLRNAQEIQYDITWYFKNNKVAVRLDNFSQSMGDATFLHVAKSGDDIIMYSDAKNEEGKSIYFKSPAIKPVSKISVNSYFSGGKKEMKGYSMEEVVVEDKNEESRVWFTNDFNYDFGAVFNQFSTDNMNFVELMSEHGFPLEYTTSQNGKLVMFVKFSEISTNPVSQEYFVVPNGYELVQQ